MEFLNILELVLQGVGNSITFFLLYRNIYFQIGQYLNILLKNLIVELLSTDWFYCSTYLVKQLKINVR